MKKNIETIPNALDKVLKLRGVNFQWKNSEKYKEKEQIGFVAQEVEDILPEVVEKADGHYAMQYAPINALLVEAVKEQQKMINYLKNEIEQLKLNSKENNPSFNQSKEE